MNLREKFRKWLCSKNFHSWSSAAELQGMMASSYQFLECSCGKKIVRYESLSMAGTYQHDMTPDEYLDELAEFGALDEKTEDFVYDWVDGKLQT